MSFPKDVERLLAKALDEMPKSEDYPADAQRQMYVVALGRATLALKEAILMTAHEVENLRRSVEARESASDTD